LSRVIGDRPKRQNRDYLQSGTNVERKGSIDKLFTARKRNRDYRLSNRLILSASKIEMGLRLTKRRERKRKS